jgi:hypothetical protein
LSNKVLRKKKYRTGPSLLEKYKNKMQKTIVLTFKLNYKSWKQISIPINIIVLEIEPYIASSKLKVKKVGRISTFLKWYFLAQQLSNLSQQYKNQYFSFKKLEISGSSKIQTKK